jgi:uncharacterized protein (TIGR03086 family)
MSQQHIDIWNSCADAFSQRYDAITDEQWAASTPCPDWSVKDLVDHAVGVQAQYIGNLVGADIAEGADWPAVRAAIGTALAAEGALDGMTEMPGMGQVPKMVPVGIGSSDLLIHSWDLARAIGADETLPAEAVAATHAGLQRFPPEMMRNSTMFGDAVDCADDADAQTQMLSFAGRAV